MDIKLCQQCIYYAHNMLTLEDLCTYEYHFAKNGYIDRHMVRCEDVIDGYYGYRQCNHFQEKKDERYSTLTEWRKDGIITYPHHINIKIGDDKMRNDNFVTTLRSYNDKKCNVISTIDIKCEDFETFKKIVEAVMPILKKEDIKKECD